ncbi:MAG: FAD:protein FMN transferase [Gammaproteobacteria bacterium]|nr:FAD:protein FMN transferase [Gammaproteobacteria bacterium]
MASPCELLVDSDDSELAKQITHLALTEASRIEEKFSRYRNDNIVHKINNSTGGQIEVDKETAQLLDFSAKLYQLSDGMFDITSGVLRKAWQFDGSDHVPDDHLIGELLPNVGWPKLEWRNPIIRVPTNMQIDFGGIGKEYAVDRCVQLIMKNYAVACLVNFGGDLAVTGPRQNNESWQIGIESVQAPGQNSGKILSLSRGAIATSGDVRRFVLKDGKRYGHILNPKTGWPVEGAPRSVTVTAATCTEAGMLATFAMLHGQNCESFLDAEGITYWSLR